MSKSAAEPTWDIVDLFPRQGEWSVAEYLDLDTNHLVEYVEGHLQVPAMPGEWHQLIVGFLYVAVLNFTEARAPGVTAMAPLKLRVSRRRFREPDVLFVKE